MAEVSLREITDLIDDKLDAMEPESSAGIESARSTAYYTLRNIVTKLTSHPQDLDEAPEWLQLGVNRFVGFLKFQKGSRVKGKKAKKAVRTMLAEGIFEHMVEESEFDVLTCGTKELGEFAVDLPLGEIVPVAEGKRYLPERRRPFKRSAAKVGRNDPCPCGSGSKQKYCVWCVGGQSA